MWDFVIIPLVSLVLVWTWQFLDWVWVRPRKMERVFRQQGMKGSSYKFLYGDTKEADLMYQKAYSKPLIGLEEDFIPRLMPNILDTVQKYGNFSFIWSGPRPRVFVTDVAHIKEMMSKYRTYHKSYKISNHINKMLVSGLAYLEGDEWATARARLNPAFHVDRLKTMVPAIQECCHVILDQWKEMTAEEGGACVIDVTSHLEVLTSSVLARLMFDSEYTDRIKQTFFQLSELSNLGKLAIYSFTLPGEKYLPTKKNRRAKEINKFIRSTFASLINERFAKRKAEESRSSRDLLDILMEDLYEEQGMDERERKRIIEGIIGHCKIFFFAGYETSSNVLCWTLIILSYHREWQNRAREEVVKVLGDKKDITSDDLGKLKIVTMIVHEVLRLYPAGMEIWGEDAAKFNPGRFAEGVAKATKGEAAYIPFGWGPRICIAQNLSLMEIKLFVAMLVRSFALDLSPAYAHAPYVYFTIYPQYGAPLVVKKL